MKPATIFLVACIGLGVIFLSGLGVWQLQRLAWKQGLIARVEQNLKNPPVELSDIEIAIRNGKDIEYLPVRVEGRFHNDKEQHFFATHNSRVGYYVYTPLELADGRMLFVNRGFVPVESKEVATRTSGQIEGLVRINGLARSAPAEKPNSFVPDNDLAKNVFHWKSLSQMAGRAYEKAEVETVGLFVDADASPNPGGLPIGGVTRIEFPNSHLQYALTWFGLAGALLVVGGYFLRSRRNLA